MAHGGFFVDEGIGQDKIRDYSPDRLLDVLRGNHGLKNDAALARALEVARPVISDIRHRRSPVGGALLIRMHEVFGLRIFDLRYLMGDRRRKFRISGAQGRPKKPRTTKLADTFQDGRLLGDRAAAARSSP